MAESAVARQLAPHVGKSTAHDLVDRAARRRSTRASASRMPSRRIRKSPGRSAPGRSRTHSEPADYLGVSAQFVARSFALQRTRRRKHGESSDPADDLQGHRLARRRAGRCTRPAAAPPRFGTTSRSSGGRKSSRCPRRYRVVSAGRSADTASRRRDRRDCVALDDLGADAVSVLDAAGVERGRRVQVSLGGMTAMWLAARPGSSPFARRRQHRIEDPALDRCGKSASVRFAPAAPNRSPTRRWDAGLPNASAVRIPTSYRGAGRADRMPDRWLSAAVGL